jgi:hypothetical protein
MKRTPVYVTVRDDHTTAIEGRPEFPVDGDALHDQAALRKRAESRIVSDPGLMAAARTWLGKPLDQSDPPLTPAQVARSITTLFTGGAPCFVAVAPTLQKVQAAS